MKAKGFGDTVKSITSATGVDSVVKSVSNIIGVPCGCDKRQRDWNNPELLINRAFYSYGIRNEGSTVRYNTHSNL